MDTHALWNQEFARGNPIFAGLLKNSSQNSENPIQGCVFIKTCGSVTTVEF
jgi:hypothetical protein